MSVGAAEAEVAAGKDGGGVQGGEEAVAILEVGMQRKRQREKNLCRRPFLPLKRAYARYIHACIRVYTNTLTYIHTHTQMHKCAHTHTHTHVHIFIPFLSFVDIRLSTLFFRRG